MIVYISTKSTKSTYFFKICKNEEFIYFNKIFKYYLLFLPKLIINITKKKNKL